MKRSRILSAIFFGLVTVSLILVSCQSKGRTMTIVMVEGQPEIQKKGTGVWKPVGVGVVVKPGDSLRTGPGEYIWMEIDDGSVFGLGRETEARLETLSVSYTDPVTLIDLKDGMVFVTVTKDLGEGSFEVKTPIIKVGVVGSKMAVDYDSTKSTADIACLEGTVEGKYGDDTASPQVGSGYILGVSVGTRTHEYNGYTYAVRSTDEVYNEFSWFDSRYKSSYEKTVGPLYTATSLTQTQKAIELTKLAKITPSITSTEEPTITLNPIITSTPKPLFILRPTITVGINQPPSKEEAANSGMHNYSHNVTFSGQCNGSALTGNEQIDIIFEGNQAIMTRKEFRSEFDKVDDNTYQGIDEEGWVVVTFTETGFVADKYDCYNWVFIRQD